MLDLAIFRKLSSNLFQLISIMLGILTNCRGAVVWSFFSQNHWDIFAFYWRFSRQRSISLWREGKERNSLESAWWVQLSFCEISWICDIRQWDHFCHLHKYGKQRISWMQTLLFSCCLFLTLYFHPVMLLLQERHRQIGQIIYGWMPPLKEIMRWMLMIQTILSHFFIILLFIILVGL